MLDNSLKILCIKCGNNHKINESHQYIYKETNIDKDICCAICLNPPDIPVDSPCQHTFCKICITKALTYRQHCPIDNKPLYIEDLKNSSLMLYKVLNKLIIKCPICEIFIERASFVDHFLTCPNKIVDCPHFRKGCKNKQKYCNLDLHLSQCPYEILKEVFNKYETEIYSLKKELLEISLLLEKTLSLNSNIKIDDAQQTSTMRKLKYTDKKNIARTVYVANSITDEDLRDYCWDGVINCQCGRWWHSQYVKLKTPQECNKCFNDCYSSHIYRTEEDLNQHNLECNKIIYNPVKYLYDE
jgi:hypothetical protein